LIANLEKEVQVLGLTARQAAILEAVNSGADPKDVNRLHLLYNKIEAHKKEQKALKDKAAEDKAASDKLENFNAKLDEQAQLMTLVGDALYLYQAQQAGATGADAKALAEKIKLNAELKEAARLKKEEAAEAKRADDKAEADAKIEAKRIESLRVQGAIGSVKLK
jgi:hypothetical protein